MQNIEGFVVDQLATVGALVDDGLLDWERPLRDYVPEVQLHDPVVSDRLTVVDLLSHRSGLPRYEMAWLGHPGRTRAEVMRRLRFLPLSKDLRQAFQYCNLGYLAAGYAVEVLSGTPWEDYLRDRLLTPLGMGRSNLSVDEMSADPDHATAYERRQGVVVPVPQRPITALAPAGAVNSCAADLTRWLLAQLGDQSHLFPLMFLSDPDGDITALTVPFESLVEPQRFDRRPDASAQDPEVLRRLCGTYVMGPVEVVVALRGDHVLTVAIPGAPPFELEPTARGLRFGLKGQPAVTAEFELDDSGNVARLVAQPLGIFRPKP